MPRSPQTVEVVEEKQDLDLLSEALTWKQFQVSNMKNSKKYLDLVYI